MVTPMSLLRLTLLLALSVTLAAGPALSQSKKKPDKTKPAASKQQQPKVPNDATLTLLIRWALISLSNANMTGNYTTLRDLGAPGFGAANSAAKLGAVFTTLRGKQMDLTPVLVVDPKLYRKPSIEKNGMLRITGFVPLKPEKVNFDLLFQNVNGIWRLFGISVRVGDIKQAEKSKNGDKKTNTAAGSQENTSEDKLKPARWWPFPE